MNETDIVRRAKQGDSHAFEQLVTQYEKQIYNLAYHYTGNEHDAMDASQEIFLKVYRFLPQFNEESLFSTWLYRVASNVCKDVLRKRYAKNEVSFSVFNDDEEEYTFDVPDMRYDPSSELERKELRKEIHQSLSALSPDHREILILRDIVGLSYEDISSSLELGQGTVKSRIARAREKLRAKLAENGNFFARPASKSSKGGR